MVGKACWTLSVSGIDHPLSAHVHKAPRRELGPVVIPLGSRFSRKGCVIAPKPSLRAVASAPGDYYVDIHTRDAIEGALRGQLRASSS